MSTIKKLTALAAILLLVLVVSSSTVSAARFDMQGLVYIDDNLNGVWDVGEAGYGGVYQWVEDEEVNRYVGATITVITPAYDEYEVESAPYRELEEHEKVACTQQDLVIDGEINPNPVRPCSGTWGLPVWAEDVRMEIHLTVPEGYYATSPNPIYCVTCLDSPWIDFGIAPLASDS
ncbi:MAG: hypothetical protein H6667_10325 [Ardenticatenaceae bacterium]|nr:hypothetical protein [Ardenticatenaceae bacterium]MCB9446416.1 hypothetical protein [Ardenticatenaceae bacterium]